MKNSMLKSPFKYMGGKSRLASWIITCFPPHTRYAEPFGGAAHVLIAKESSRLDVYNDINNDLVNLFKVLQHPAHYSRLLNLLRLTPYSRKFFAEIRDGIYLPPGEHPSVLQAYRTLILMNQGFSGDWMNHLPSWSCDRKTSVGCSRFTRLINRLPEIVERLRQVQIECLDFRECITRYDSPETLFYCDPPYFGKEAYYQGNFSKRDHEDLARLLNDIRGKACVSYYDFPELEDMYPASKWSRINKTVSVPSSKSSRCDTCKRAEEILLIKRA